MNPHLSAGYGPASGEEDLLGALVAAQERLSHAHNLSELTERRQECQRLAERLRQMGQYVDPEEVAEDPSAAAYPSSHPRNRRGTWHAPNQHDGGINEQLLAINKVLHSELLRHRLRADSFEKCCRWRLSFSCDKEKLSSAFDRLLELSIAHACGIVATRVVVLSSGSTTGEVDFTITEDPTAASPSDVIEELRDQLGDALSPFRTGAFAKFASCVLQLGGVLPSQHCLWAPDPAAPLAEALDPVAEGLSRLNELAESVAHPDEEEEDEDVAKRPEYWGLHVRDLSAFNSSIHDELVSYCQDHHVHFEHGHCIHLCKHGANCPWGDHEGVLHDKTRDASRMPGTPLLPNMHAVVSRYVKPQTRAKGTSWAAMKYPQGLRITHFVTHTWEELFSDFVGSLEAALSPENVVWVCSLALNQNANITEMLDVELLKSPFAVALRRASRQLVLLDRDLKVPTRSWCAYELAIATKFAMPTFLWPHPGSDVEKLRGKVKSLDLRDAVASKKEDEDRIRQEIESSEGYDKLNSRFRCIMELTLNFYSNAMSQVAGLTQQMEEAAAANDASKQAALKAARDAELRRLEVSHSAEQRAALLTGRCRELEEEVLDLRRRLKEAEAQSQAPSNVPEVPVVRTSGCFRSRRRFHRF